MGVKIFVFGSKEGLFDVRGKNVDVDEGTIFFKINFVKKIAVTVEDLGGELRWIFNEVLRMRKLIKNLKVNKNREKGKSKEKN